MLHAPHAAHNPPLRWRCNAPKTAVSKGSAAMKGVIHLHPGLLCPPQVLCALGNDRFNASRGEGQKKTNKKKKYLWKKKCQKLEVPSMHLSTQTLSDLLCLIQNLLLWTICGKRVWKCAGPPGKHPISVTVTTVRMGLDLVDPDPRQVVLYFTPSAGIPSSGTLPARNESGRRGSAHCNRLRYR